MTAVEWLAEVYKKRCGLYNSDIEQAKELEKQHIIEAYETGYSDSDNTFTLNKNYYNEKFKK